MIDYIKSLLFPSTNVHGEMMATAALLGCFLSAALGGMDKAIYALAALAAADCGTGIAAAFKTGCLSSGVSFKGFAKKLAMFGAVAFANLVDTGMQINLLRDMTITAYSANECLSIVENLDRCGWSGFIPTFLKNRVEEIKNRKTGGGV